MQDNSISIFKKAGIVGLAVLLPLSASFADFQIKTKGGIKVFDPADDTYSFELSGALKFDETLFRTKNINRNNFPSGANLRAADLSFSGGIAKNWSYSFDTEYGSGGEVTIGCAHAKYAGFKNMSFLIGQFYFPFGLENSNSSKWTGFLEKSMPTSAFSPPKGLGLNYQVWKGDWAFSIALANPEAHANSNENSDQDSKYGSDRFNYGARLVYHPIAEKEQVLHTGISAFSTNIDSETRLGAPLRDKQFASKPEAKSRNVQNLLDTGKLQIRGYSTAGTELAWMNGPLLVQAEYMWANARQVHETAKRLKFSGWQTQASYVLTGEVHDYNQKMGSFGKVTPEADTGAWEIAFRHSFLNLNDKNVQAGSAHNTSFGLSWYMNENIRWMANYVHVDKTHGANSVHRKGKMDIVGARVQVVW